jgi:WD40 repeat protein
MGWPVESLAFTPQGRYLAAGKLDGLLLLLDVETGRRLQSVAVREELGQIQCLAFSSDGGTLFAGGYRGRLQAWEVDDAGRLQPADSLQGHTQAVTCLATSPVAPFLLSGSVAGDLVWQSYKRASAEARHLIAFERSVLAIHLPSSGVLALATDGRRMVQFDLGSAQTVKVSELAGSGAQAAAFSPDGSTLAVCHGSEIRLVDTRTGSITRTLSSGHEMQWSLLFLPDGHRLVSGGRGAATLWNLADGQPLGSIDLGGILYIKTLAAAREGNLVAAIPSAAGQTLSVVRMPEFLPPP